MAGESSSTNRVWSNLSRGTSAPKKISAPRERISFRELARFAQRKKTVDWLVHATGKDASTIKRYLRRQNEPPSSVVNVVVTDILQRLDLSRTERDQGSPAAPKIR